MCDELEHPTSGAPLPTIEEPTALREQLGPETAWVESAARWLEFHMERFAAMWWQNTLVDEDPLAPDAGAEQPTLDELHRAVALLRDDIAELSRLLDRVHDEPRPPVRSSA